LPVLGPLLGAACLPDPDIKVPDFKPAGVVDLAVAPADAGALPDAGRIRWQPDAMIPTTQTLRGITSDSSGQVFVVGHGGQIWRRTAVSWVAEPAVDGAKTLTTNLYGVVSSGADFYAVGDAGVVLRRVTDKWQQEGKELGVTVALLAITALPSGDLYVVGDGGTLLRKPAGGAWSRDSSDAALANADFRAVAVSKPDELFAVGAGGVIARRSSGKWSPDSVAIDAGERGNFSAVVVTSESVFVAGEYNRVLRRDADKWRREPTAPLSGTGGNLFALVASGLDLVAVGQGGNIQRRDGKAKTWTLDDSGTTFALSAVSASPVLRAVGAQGTVVVQK